MEQPITKLDYFAGQILNAMMVTSGSKIIPVLARRAYEDAEDAIKAGEPVALGKLQPVPAGHR